MSANKGEMMAKKQWLVLKKQIPDYLKEMLSIFIGKFLLIFWQRPPFAD